MLTLTNFEVDNGPDLRVYLVAGPARDESEVEDFEDLGALKGNKGNQQYDIPRGLDLESLLDRRDLVPGLLRELRPGAAHMKPA